MSLFTVDGFCSARVGFPNASYRNGSYNAFALVCAHTRMADHVLAKTFHVLPSNTENTAPTSVLAQQKIEVNETTRRRSLEILQILRGETEGTLTELDSRVFYKTCLAAARLYGLPVGYKPYLNVDELKADPKATRLQVALNDPDWRVIRVQAKEHSWVLVRNPDNTVDLVMDAQITPKYMTLETIHRFWKQPAEWQKLELSFYPAKERRGFTNEMLVFKNMKIDSICEAERPVYLENCTVLGDVQAPNMVMKHVVVSGDVLAGKEFSLDDVKIHGTFSYVLDSENPSKKITSSEIEGIHILCPDEFSKECSSIPLLDLRGTEVTRISSDDLPNGMRILKNGMPDRSITMTRKSN